MIRKEERQYVGITTIMSTAFGIYQVSHLNGKHQFPDLLDP